MSDREPRLGSFEALEAARAAKLVRVINVDTDTPAVWGVAWSPAVISVIAVLGMLLGLVSPAAGFVFGLLPIAALVAFLVLAGSDRAELRRRGSDDAPSTLWMFGTPIVWLIVRWLRLRHFRGSNALMPLVVFGVQLVLIGLVALFWLGMLGFLTSP